MPTTHRRVHARHHANRKGNATEWLSSAHLAVVMCLFEQALDPYFELPRRTSIRGLEMQTHSHWHMVARGDAPAGPALPRARAMLEESAIPTNKIEWDECLLGGRAHLCKAGSRHLHVGDKCLPAHEWASNSSSELVALAPLGLGPRKHASRGHLGHRHGQGARARIGTSLPIELGRPNLSWWLVARNTTGVILVLVAIWYVRELRLSFQTEGERFSVLAKRGSLVTGVVQNCFGVLWLRYCRTAPESRQDPAAVLVLLAEVLKLVACVFCVLVTRGGLAGLLDELDAHIWRRKLDTLKLAVPSGCYAFCNNLQFVAAQNLSAVMLHMVERTKVPATACLSIIILHRSLRPNQWAALLLIVVGVSLAQSGHAEAAVTLPGTNVLIGMCAALGVSFVSSFSGVWVELVLKSSETSLALRNIQLALFSIPLQLLTCLYLGHPLLATLSWISWVMIVNLAFAGLLIAAIMRFADNNLKNLAQALAAILSALISIPLFGFQPNVTFIVGAALVIGSAFLYVWIPHA